MDIFLAFIAGALALYAVARLSAWRKWRGRPVVYDVPPGLYRSTPTACRCVEDPCPCSCHTSGRLVFNGFHYPGLVL